MGSDVLLYTSPAAKHENHIIDITRLKIVAMLVDENKSFIIYLPAIIPRVQSHIFL